MPDGRGRIQIIGGRDKRINKLLTKATADRPIVYAKVASKHTLPDCFDDDNLTLLQRDRVYQEQLLFPRILQLEFIDLLWECNGTRSCSCGSARTVSGGKHHRNRPVKPQHTVCLRPGISGDHRAGRWANIIKRKQLRIWRMS